jgi:hypothetical protein
MPSKLIANMINLLALPQVPAEIAEACAAGQIGFVVVTALATLKSPRKDGIASCPTDRENH